MTSTQDVARELARAGAAPFTAVLADAQSEGRGRMGRTWVSRPSLGLHLSIVLPPRAGALRGLTLAVALAARDAIGIPGVLLKWPNDLLASGRKLGGILVDAETGPEPSAILGIGVNLRHVPEDFPGEIRDIATSIAMLGIEPPGPVDLAERIVSRCEATLATLARGGFEPLRSAWLAACAWREGDGVSVRDGGREIRGTFAGIADDGAIRLREPSGAVVEIRTGEPA
ncbi:MAG: biotin--[acetyl-CoA-carboxylase] ligase [Acidobacteriota bacterium]